MMLEGNEKYVTSPLFDMGPAVFDPQGPNTVAHGENLEILAAMPDASFTLIYVDPPFNTGRKQTRAARPQGGARPPGGGPGGFKGGGGGPPFGGGPAQPQ